MEAKRIAMLAAWGETDASSSQKNSDREQPMLDGTPKKPKKPAKPKTGPEHRTVLLLKPYGGAGGGNMGMNVRPSVYNSFSLDKASGKKCFMLGARELAIECGRFPVNWTWRHLPQSRFWEQANLRAAPCFDISGKIEARLLSPKTTYVVYLLFDLGPLKYGYKGLPAKASVRFEGERGDGSGDGEGDEITNIVSLAIRRFSSGSGGQFAQQRMDKWMETELGEFFNGQGNTGEVEIRLMGFEGDYRTYDLFVEGIELRPKIDY